MNRNTSRIAMAIMAKESRPGHTKTRMVPPLNFEEAAALNTCFLRDIARTIDKVAASAPISGFAAYDPAGSETFFQAILPAGFGLIWPGASGLGAALAGTAAQLLGRGFASVCLINSDSPNLPSGFLASAAARLAEPGNRIVLGPAEDGGYYLIGLKHPHPRLFQDIAWSTAAVFAQTRQRVAELALPETILPAWYDVDDQAALVRLAGDLDGSGRERAEAPHAAAFLAGLQAAGRLALALHTSG